MAKRHREKHRTQRTGWLRAAVLGANDGIVSTASLIVGVASSGASRHTVLVAGIAGLVAGAMSMAAGEYVSVSSQADTERADLDRERHELEADVESERRELAHIYMKRGLDAALARQVAIQLMQHDALGAHARDELGISDALKARPIQAALTSAVTFATGAAVPLLTVLVFNREFLPHATGTIALFCLAGLGALAARAGGSSVLRGSLRVVALGALAMLITGAVGSLFGLTVDG
jgi:VIT1/CCC1 family predicted Fe2+/Mn2+ transporter